MNKKEGIIKEYRQRVLEHPQIKIEVQRTSRGNLIVSVKDFPGCRTQARDLAELIDMVNDAVYTYFEIPEEFHDMMPTYLPPVKLAKTLNAYPTKNVGEPVELKIEV